jgi:hypothetical protein
MELIGARRIDLSNCEPTDGAKPGSIGAVL